jgi:hypothetical protein
MPKETLAIREPFVANECLSHLVPEAAAQTFKGNNFITLNAAGRAIAAPATPASPVAADLLNIGFALEPGHNYTVSNMESMVEITNRDVLIEVTLKGNSIPQVDLIPGTRYGLGIDGATGYYVADYARKGIALLELVRLSGRGILANGKAIYTSGYELDDNPRIIVRILASAGIPS